MSTLEKTHPIQIIAGENLTANWEGTFSYRQEAPFEILLELHTETGAIPWTLSREQLLEALKQPTGEGDVIAWSDDTSFYLTLKREDKEAHLELAIEPFMTTLQETLNLVPIGKENCNIDTVITQILENVEK